MNVQLYIYDLSKGLARNLSGALLGVQIDAIYHTSVVFEGIEYTYDGGVKTVRPGSTHLGKPLQVLELGKTDLPMDVILEYLDSLKAIYTFEAYDLWKHNCNNFSNDFATFLVGKGIPEYITNLPETVLNTPFGRMVQPHFNDYVTLNSMNNGGLLGIQSSEDPQQQASMSQVRHVTTSTELDNLLKSAKKKCAVIFFTSRNCAPCKTLYPVFEQLAKDAGRKAILIIVDISRSYEIATKYGVTTTPSFATYLQGEEEKRWAGGDIATLRANVGLLVQMAFPPHAHESLRLPALRAPDMLPVIYTKVPPLEKLKAKMGPAADVPAVKGVLHFVSEGQSKPAAETHLPDLDAFSWFLREAPSKLPTEIMFTIVDLLRCALVDPRLSGYYAEESNHKTIAPLFTYVDSLKDCPYSLRLVALQAGCNLFTSPLYPQHILGCPTLTNPLVQLITTSLLDDAHHNVRVAAASLAFNMAFANSSLRIEDHKEVLPESEQIELAASLLEAIQEEKESPEALKGYLLAFGHLVFGSPKAGELVDLLKSMDAQKTIMDKAKAFPKETLIKEIGQELLAKGLE
ncbi:123e1eb5-9b6d-4d6f-bd95-90e901397d17 [Sclerotinia trifoliorum]|uniref:123e1eb5-9b6d-4d6f-bd95-90e901397d17 n=1 Tax=Sclerotinia trifoliorum TaxID=28548 RepID=A0A8H2VLI3_9HELO|nr:123e1eb5-9b6d-4d6f-bd95-90e901397d17 [Sclerotinia trifoliorum]